MTDRYASFAHTRPGGFVVRRLGLPEPPRLRRYTPGEPEFDGPVLLGGRGRMLWPVSQLLERLGIPAATTGNGTTAEAGRGGGPTPEPAPERPAALVFDATGIADSGDLRGLYDFFHPVVRGLRPCGRVIVFGTPPDACGPVRQATAQRAIEGFARSLGKEVGHGRTVQLVQVAPGGEDAVESTVRFLLSGRSAYVSGQVIRIGPAVVTPPADWRRPYDGAVAVVTGAARGIGAATARVLARDGARVACLDVPAAGEALAKVANEVRGSAFQLDLAAPDAPGRLAGWLEGRYGRVDVLVHNAGVTRDRTLARMPAEQWESVIDVNLAAQERVNDTLFDRGLIADGGRLVAVASVSGIAGNRGQTNYATSKAGVIGLVAALAPVVAARGVTVNAVAPGFIETRMTARMPAAPRIAGRRLNSLAQGGLPIDVAETVAWLAGPATGGVTGSVVRVCGQSFLGA